MKATVKILTVFATAAALTGCAGLNSSTGAGPTPDPVPDSIRQDAETAIQMDRNGYMRVQYRGGLQTGFNPVGEIASYSLSFSAESVSGINGVITPRTVLVNCDKKKTDFKANCTVQP